MSASQAHSPGAGLEEDGFQGAIHPEGEKEGELQSCVLGLVRAFVTSDKTGTGTWVTGCQGRIRHPGSLGPTLSLNQAGVPEMSSNLLNVTELVRANT